MKTNEDLLRKWLDNELDASELQAFNALEDSALLEKISLAMQSFKAPEYDSVLEFEKLKSALKSPVNLVVRPNFRAVWSYAAALLIGLGLFLQFVFQIHHKQPTWLRLNHNAYQIAQWSLSMLHQHSHIIHCCGGLTAN